MNIIFFNLLLLLYTKVMFVSSSYVFLELIFI